MSQGDPILPWHATKAGKNSWTSPRPVSSSSTPRSAAFAHPPPGKRASSELLPVDQTGRVGAAEASFNFQTRASAKISAIDAASRGIHVFTTTQHTDDHPFNNHGLFFEIAKNGLEIGVFGQQPNNRAFLPVAFHRDFVFQTRDHDLSIAHFRRAVHGD